MTNQMRIKLAAGSGETFGVDDIACAAATHLGFWEREGLDVSWTPARGGMAAMKLALSGEVDVAYAGLGPVINLRAQGHPCRVVVSMARGLAQNLVAQAPIQTTEDLTGLSWAIDGIDALSHHMARLVVKALGVNEGSIEWQVVGPPPQRIDSLLKGHSDVSLIRVEESVSLHKDKGNGIHILLGLAELKKRVPIQPHGVLATTESYEKNHRKELDCLTRGMILASRALHNDFKIFQKVFNRHVTVPLDDEDIYNIWKQEHDEEGWAVDGEISQGHWKWQLELYGGLYPNLRQVTRQELISEDFVHEALKHTGR